MLLKMHGAIEELREEEDSSTCDHNHESAHTSNLLAWSYLDWQIAKHRGQCAKSLPT